MSVLLINGNALQIPLADNSVHCVVTSPPYWSLRDYGIDNQLGLEQTPEEYVANMVAVFREVRRVLREDGTCWVNLGDSYASQTKGSGGPTPKQASNVGSFYDARRLDHGLKDKDLVGIPWRVAFALQADGWWLRSDIIWSKPNPMPESVTDRPTKAHEYLFLLAKSQRYYYDADSVREEHKDKNVVNGVYIGNGVSSKDYEERKWIDRSDGVSRPPVTVKQRQYNPAGRNRRTVWEIATAPYSGAHFATYPPALVEPCIKAGTSERGVCPVCGKPWVRVVERPDMMKVDNSSIDRYGTGQAGVHRKVGQAYQDWRSANPDITLGWQPACNCPPHEPIPATVFDPFAGSGTTLMVARKLGRHGVGLDLSLRYLTDNARQRLELDRLDAWGSDGKKDGKVIDDLPLFRL